MSLRNILAAALVVLPATVWAALPPGVVIDRKVFVPDGRLNAQLRLISDRRQFDESAARTLIQILTANGLSINEQDLVYEFIAARTPVTVTITLKTKFDIPPPSPAAREFLTLFRTVSEAGDLGPVLDERWLAGPRQMKEFVDISTIAPDLNNKVGIFLSRKWTASWMNSNPENGFAPLKDEIAKFVAQLMNQTDSEVERRGLALGLAAMRDANRRLDNAIPEDLYASLQAGR